VRAQIQRRNVPIRRADELLAPGNHLRLDVLTGQQRRVEPAREADGVLVRQALLHGDDGRNARLDQRRRDTAQQRFLARRGRFTGAEHRQPQVGAVKGRAQRLRVDRIGLAIRRLEHEHPRARERAVSLEVQHARCARQQPVHHRLPGGRDQVGQVELVALDVRLEGAL